MDQSVYVPCNGGHKNKLFFLIAVPLRRGGEAVPLRKKTFFQNFFFRREVPTAIKLEGEGDKIRPQ